ncbi:BZ3500_MvSof-1268-A1-R1_Chr8-2g10089 [Microbotryum saponariae]|uniref:BZ3500_MvSof-1268-A1-R1_Chr8-2g10089 protein n=1 Tax=Microbotryum saponariae TaxID=289078 RepID=A0A2X0MPP4_9BASI|nr:BZ3500_MvSof-1268-A1-R1_Chr8-2g10089 [Microbotryum saponariae]SDA01763.1 BZ3501_MvSof-1269-A2-R1_Chr8-2g09840 [Microbotryum saponariae]
MVLCILVSIALKSESSAEEVKSRLVSRSRAEPRSGRGGAEASAGLSLPQQASAGLAAIPLIGPDRCINLSSRVMSQVEFAQSYRSDQGTLDCVRDGDVSRSSCSKIYGQDKTKFAIVERYTDGKAIKTHTANPLYPQFGKWIAPLVASPPVVTVYTEFGSAKL